MSLADDQIINNSNHPLDEYSRRINKIPSSDIPKAISITQRFEDDLEKAKEIKPESQKEEEKVNQEDLLKGIKDDMTR